MGCYVNPTNMSKEDWLRQHGRRVSIDDVEIAESELPVCLVDNGMFRAAGVAYDERELEAFSVPSDTRPKVWFMVSREALRTASDLIYYER